MGFIHKDMSRFPKNVEIDLGSQWGKVDAIIHEGSTRYELYSVRDGVSVCKMDPEILEAIALQAENGSKAVAKNAIFNPLNHS